MPKPRTKIRSSHLVKYAFPVVRDAIDKVGPPREIAKVAPPQRGPLLVTLAMDLSADCERELAAYLEAGGEKPLPPEGLVPDLFEGLTVKSGGAGQILLATNARWWASFAGRAEAKFGALARETGPIRIRLRSAIARDEVARHKDYKKRNIEAIWLEIARDPHPDSTSWRWPRFRKALKYDETDIRKLSSRLVQEDRAQKKWIHSHAGAWHPSTSSYWDENPKRILEYPARRALSELYYCLAQGTSGWTPTFPESFSRADWENWLDKASGGSPPYWCPM